MAHINNQCPICKNINNHNLYSLQKGTLKKCNNCQLVFFNPRPTPKELEIFYSSQEYRKSYSESSMSGQNFATNRYQQLITILKKYRPESHNKSGQNLLDIGCGDGDLLRIASQQNWNASGTEVALSDIIIQKLSDQKIKIYQGDLLSIEIPEDHFDLITCYHVIEHLLEPIPILKKIRKLLKPNGLAFFETPNIGGVGAMIKKEKWSQIKPPEHINYFNLNSLKYMLEKCGFQNTEVFTISPQKIQSISDLNSLNKKMAKQLYDLSSALNLGATLQAIATK